MGFIDFLNVKFMKMPKIAECNFLLRLNGVWIIFYQVVPVTRRGESFENMKQL